MSTREKLIKARLGMLALAEELQNISWACRRAGISRSHFYEIKEAFEKYGAVGVTDNLARRIQQCVRPGSQQATNLRLKAYFGEAGVQTIQR